jgi:hypothetical protein
VSISEHVYERKYEHPLTGFVRKGRDSVPATHFTGCESSVIRLSKSGDFLCKLALNAKQATYDEGERRHEHRVVTNDPAVLQIVNPFSDECSGVRIVDVSNNGLGLYTPKAVMPGSLLKLRMKDYLAFGEARHCRPAKEGFFVGVQLHDYVSHCTLPKDIIERRKAV